MTAVPNNNNHKRVMPVAAINPLLLLPRHTQLPILNAVGPIPDAPGAIPDAAETRSHAYYALQIQNLMDKPRRFRWFWFQKIKFKSPSLQNHHAKVCQYVNELCRRKATVSSIEPLSPSMLQAECLDIVHRLLKSQFGWNFSKPVDPIKLMMPNYFDIVTHPMDLGTIQTKLESGEYHNFREFTADVHLCFDNVSLYHGPDDTVSQLSQFMKDQFDCDCEVLNLDAGYQQWQKSLATLLESRFTTNNSNITSPVAPSVDDSSFTESVEKAEENDVILFPEVHSDDIEKFQTKDIIRRSLMMSEDHS